MGLKILAGSPLNVKISNISGSEQKNSLNGKYSSLILILTLNNSFTLAA